MSNGNSIVNLGDLAKPATVLIEKVSSAVGILYEPRRIRNRAKAEADADKTKAIASMELTELQERAMQRMVHQEARKQENIENITSQAAQDLPEDAESEKLDEDWIAHFFDKCENVSDKQMQSLWSNLLAGEATKPGTYSKRTVDLVASMDKKDALLFTEFCQFTWMIGEPTPLIIDPQHEIYTSKGINFGVLKHLDAIGLVSFESLSGYKRQGFNNQAVVFYFGLPTLIDFSEKTEKEIEIGKVLFTQPGKELVHICHTSRNQKFYEYCIEQLSKQGLVLSSMLLNNQKQADA